MGECEGVLVLRFNGSIRIEGRPERLTDNPDSEAYGPGSEAGYEAYGTPPC